MYFFAKYFSDLLNAFKAPLKFPSLNFISLNLVLLIRHSINNLCKLVVYYTFESPIKLNNF